MRSIASHAGVWQDLFDYRSDIIALISAIIAAAALVVAMRAQRLSRELADRAGRLRSVALTKVNVGNRRYTRGFTARNGPDEVTITNVLLCIAYELANDENSWTVRRFERYLRASSFELLGIQGPELPIRLAAYDEQTWKLPRKVIDFPYSVTINGQIYAQHLELRLRVTASGEQMISEPLGLGDQHQAPRIISDKFPDQHLEELLSTSEQPYMSGLSLIGLSEWLRGLIEASANATELSWGIVALARWSITFLLNISKRRRLRVCVRGTVKTPTMSAIFHYVSCSFCSVQTNATPD